MRLRLRIERNALPPTQALWPVRDAKCTVAQLLELINQIFPLEADTWGLEDYSVSISGYECLHYYELGTVCKDEDEVVIKPLQYVDVRARSLTGRDQIAADGRHLVDGVPFGRPALRAPVRPEISIPPRKKRKLNLLEHGKESGRGEETGQLMLTDNGEEMRDEDEDEEDESDEDFEADASSSDASSSDESEKTEDSESSSDDDSSDSDADDSLDSSSDNTDSWDGISNSEPPTPSHKSESSVLTNGVREGHQSPADKPTGSKRKQHSDGVQENDNKQGPDTKKRKQTSDNAADHDTGQHRETKRRNPLGIPFEGKLETKRRNARRRDTKKLQYLVQIGALPKDATHQTLQQWQESNQTSFNDRRDINGMLKDAPQNGETVRTATKDPGFHKQRAKLLANIASGGVDVTLEKSKKGAKLHSNITSSTVNDIPGLMEDDDEPPSEEDNSKLPPAPLYSGSLGRGETEKSIRDNETAMSASPTTPQSKLDLAGSKRLVFGSLGVRVPKTQEEKDELQKKLADRPKRNVLSISQADLLNVNSATKADLSVSDQTMNGEADEEEDWRSKINLTAVECCDEGVELSTPPFPFHQRWDSQYNGKKAKKRVDGTYMQERKGKRTKRSEFVETYDKYNMNGDGDALDYDDVNEDDDEEYWEEGALLDGEDEDEDEEAGDADDNDGFPPLPANIKELQAVQAKEARTGDFITFAELACDESTEWQPKVVARTARILALSNSEGVIAGVAIGRCTIQLSPRDIQSKVFDKDGNRVYSKFDMPEADVEDHRERDVDWHELGDVRLVLRPEAAETNGV